MLVEANCGKILGGHVLGARLLSPPWKAMVDCWCLRIGRSSKHNRAERTSHSTHDDGHATQKPPTKPTLVPLPKGNEALTTVHTVPRTWTSGEFYVASKDAESGKINRTKVEFKNPGGAPHLKSLSLNNCGMSAKVAEDMWCACHHCFIIELRRRRDSYAT